MVRLTRWPVLVLVVLALQLAFAASASAHTRLGSSEPPDGAELAEPPNEIRLMFTGGFDSKLSGMELVDASGEPVGGELRIEQRTMIYTVPELAGGAYQVNWRLLSADSHVTEGSFGFTVLAPVEPPPEVEPPDGGGAAADGAAGPEQPPEEAGAPLPGEGGADDGEQADAGAGAGDAEVEGEPQGRPDGAGELPQPTDAHAGHDMSGHEHGNAEADWRRVLHMLLRLIDIAALTWLAGLFFFRIWIWGERRPDAPLLFTLQAEKWSAAAACLLLAATGSLHVWLLADQLGGLGGQSGGALVTTVLSSTKVGQMALLRPLLALLWLLLTFAPASSAALSVALRAAAAVGLLATFPLTGHAASGDGRIIAIAAHTVHMAAAVIWIGGLAGLFAAVRRSRSGEDSEGSAVQAMIRKFSAIALPTLVLVALAGAALTIIRLDSWQQLYQSAYGRLILIKLALVAAVAVFGYYHRRVLIPRADAAAAEGGETLAGAHRRFGFAVRGEISLAALLLVFAVLLSQTPPPLAWTPAEPLRWHVMGEEAHMTLRLAQDSPREQSLGLDVWLPTGQGEASFVQVLAAKDGAEVDIPFALKTAGPDPYGFEGFDKYTYDAQGEFLQQAGEWAVTVVVVDAEGRRFVYERAVQLN